MKKVGLFIALLLILSIVPIISAADEVPGAGEIPLVNELQQGQQTYNQYTTAENKSDYLTKQWVDILGRANYLGPVVKAISAIFDFLNPLFKIVLGYGYGLSWAFVFALAIWLAILFFVNPILSQLLNSGGLGLLASVVVASLVGISGGIRRAVEILTLLVTNTWIAWLSLLLAVIILFLAGMVGKKIKAKLKKMKEEEEKEKTEEAQKNIQTQGDIAKQELERFSK